MGEWKLNNGTKCLIPNYLNIEIDDESNVYVKDNNNLILGKKPKSSLLCAFSPSILLLVVFRAFQAIDAGMMMS